MMKLNKYDELLESSMKDAETYLSHPVSESQPSLILRLGEIEETGQTAMGPALLVSLGMALKGKSGSRVIICTDGLANVGLGSLESLESEEKHKIAHDYYTKLGELAKAKGVSISIVSIVSEECQLEMISPLADLTGGEILKLDPTNLENDFASILSENIIATKVEARVQIHKGLNFRNEDSSNISENGSVLKKIIGNAFENQEIMIEYSAKPEEELAKLKELEFSKIARLPFQVQITYLSLTGVKCVRVLTKSQEITFDREEAKKNAKYEILSVNAIQKTSKMAKEGRIREAQANALGWEKMIEGSDYSLRYRLASNPLTQALKQQQNTNMVIDRSGRQMFTKTGDNYVHQTNKASKFNTTVFSLG